MSCHRCLAAAGWADDKPDLPGTFIERCVEVKRDRAALRFRDIENALKLNNARRSLDVDRKF